MGKVADYFWKDIEELYGTDQDAVAPGFKGHAAQRKNAPSRELPKTQLNDSKGECYEIRPPKVL